ncbi:hypothetical protein X975_12442, partial [Stegodyphus mimosarum]
MTTCRSKKVILIITFISFDASSKNTFYDFPTLLYVKALSITTK